VIVELDTICREEPGAVLAFSEMVESGTEVAFPRPVQGEIRFTREGETVWVEGAVETVVTLVCGRCLRPFPHRLTGIFREGFRRGAGPPRQGADLILDLAGPELDVTEVVRQHLLMALPMAPLCRPECRGLCPLCGADRNERACACTPEEGDPRLAVLRDFHPASD